MITGGDVVLPGGVVLAGGTVLVNQGGTVHAVLENGATPDLPSGIEILMVDATGCWVTPGLIDQHLHGAFGVDFNQASATQIQELLLRLPQHGITGVLPTLITAPKLDLVMALSKLEDVITTVERGQARVMGIHLEGPFLSKEYRGAHPPQDLLTPSPENLEGLVSPSVKRITIAPELDMAMATIQNLSEQGVLCSMGHTGADYPTAMDAIRAGATSATHLFNAMKPMHHRDPGVALASLIHDDLVVEFIGDGQHVSPPMIQLALKAKPFEKVVLISDCNALTGLPAGSSMTFGKQTVSVGHDHSAVNQEGKLAGSTMLLTDCLRNLVQWGVLTFPDAVQLASYHPALYLGETPQFGQIAPGAVADLVLWSQHDLSIREVFLAGDAVFTSEPSTTSV